MNITKGFFDYHQTIDVSDNLVQSYEGEKYRYYKNVKYQKEQQHQLIQVYY